MANKIAAIKALDQITKGGYNDMYLPSKAAEVTTRVPKLSRIICFSSTDFNYL